MSHQRLSLAARRLAPVVAASLIALLAACGGGSADTTDTPADTADGQAADDTATIAAVRRGSTTAPQSGNTLQVGLALPGFPHKFDVYRPAGATRAVVFLHGLGGRSFQMARDMGLNSMMAPPTTNTVNWDWLSRNGIIAVFPQATTPPGTTLPTWSDYVRSSGQDDVGFLRALSSAVRAQYGATEVSLAGHSNGGAMTSRMWCEATNAYKAFVTLAAPMPSTSYPSPAATCTPVVPAPYYAVVGGQDSKLAQFFPGAYPPSPEQLAAGLSNAALAYEWGRHHDRSQRVCSELPTLNAKTTATTGSTWSQCGGRVRYTVVAKADHPIASLDQYAGVRMVDLIAGFVK
jgi:poly(3-hydroxybutyrate) depolymerase